MSTQPQVPDANALKERQVKIWTAGEYARIGNPIAIMGELLCEAAELRPFANALIHPSAWKVNSQNFAG